MCRRSRFLEYLWLDNDLAFFRHPFKSQLSTSLGSRDNRSSTPTISPAITSRMPKPINFPSRLLCRYLPRIYLGRSTSLRQTLSSSLRLIFVFHEPTRLRRLLWSPLIAIHSDPNEQQKANDTSEDCTSDGTYPRWSFLGRCACYW